MKTWDIKRHTFALLMVLITACTVAVPTAALAKDAPTPDFVTRGPATIGMVFREGDIPHNARVTENGKSTKAQVDPLVHWPDHSLKFARITVIRGGHYLIQPSTESTSDSTTVTPQVPPDFKVQIETSQGSFTQSLRDMKHHADSCGALLCIQSFPATPLINAETHKPSANLALRAWVWHYPTLDTSQVVATVENTWAETANSNISTKNISFVLNGKTIYEQSGVTIWRWSRTRPVRIWTGIKVSDDATRNLAYLRETGAVPNFSPTLRVSSSLLEHFQSLYEKSPHGLMGHTLVTPYMPQTGGRGDIGPLPQWDIFALLTNNPLALKIAREVDDSSAVWPIHLRSRKTLEPLSIAQYPMASTLSVALGMHGNPIPCWADNCRNPYPKTGIPLAPDVAHEPAMNYVPYLLTADPYYLSELEFWNNWNALSLNPGYRKGDKVIFLSAYPQTRAMAWQLRSLAYLSFVLPRHSEAHEFWSGVLANNRQVVIDDWINKRPYPEPIINGQYGSYNRSHGGMAPWEEDFLTWSFANLVRLGNKSWLPILKWNAGFVVHRLTDPGICPQLAALYTVKAYDADGKPVGRWPAMLRATVADKHFHLPADLLTLPCNSEALARALRVPKAGDFAGYPSSPQGFVANMQPAIAAAVDANIPGAEHAWANYQKRPTKQDYSGYPNWDIVPWQRSR